MSSKFPAAAAAAKRNPGAWSAAAATPRACPAGAGRVRVRGACTVHGALPATKPSIHLSLSLFSSLSRSNPPLSSSLSPPFPSPSLPSLHLFHTHTAGGLPGCRAKAQRDAGLIMKDYKAGRRVLEKK